MKVNDTSVLKDAKIISVEIKGAAVQIFLKNGGLFTIEPQGLTEPGFSYQLDYVTGKEMKEINKLNKKIQELENQIEGIKNKSVLILEETNEMDELEEML